MLANGPEEPAMLENGARLLGDLVAHDDWLPAQYAAPDPTRYQQFLLHADSLERFSLVSFVWGPGQSTPIHDHRVWGLVGVLRGAETNESFEREADGRLRSLRTETLLPGRVVAVSPRVGDVHRVSNAYADRASISIHLYGGNIGAVRRATYDVNGQEKSFISGYANVSLPNLWNGPEES